MGTVCGDGLWVCRRLSFAHKKGNDMLKIKDVIFEEYQGPVSPLHHDAFVEELKELLDCGENINQLFHRLRNYENLEEIALDLESEIESKEREIRKLKKELENERNKNRSA